MQKLSLYLILISTSLFIASIQSMEHGPKKGTDRIKISALLYDDQEPDKEALQQQFSTARRTPSAATLRQKKLNITNITQNNESKKLSHLAAGMKRLANEISPEGTAQQPVRFHNFSPSKEAKKGYAEEVKESYFVFEGRITADPDQLNVEKVSVPR
jgi:hypothetical protein